MTSTRVGAEVESATRRGALARARFLASIDTAQHFFERERETIARACERLAERFGAGGRLFVFGVGASASDAEHVSVEFVHPVIVGKRALPAVALTGNLGMLAGSVASEDIFASQLDILATPDDIALGLSATAMDGASVKGLAHARARGLLTIAVTGAVPLAHPEVDLAFVVPAEDPLVAQEVQETLYHILWELVHVFLEHESANV